MSLGACEIYEGEGHLAKVLVARLRPERAEPRRRQQ